GVYAGLAARLSHQYVLTYASQMRGAGHEVRVRVEAAGSSVTTGYVIPSLAPTAAPEAHGWWATRTAVAAVAALVGLVILLAAYAALRPKPRRASAQLRAWGAPQGGRTPAAIEMVERPRRTARPGSRHVWRRFGADVERGEIGQTPARVMLVGVTAGTVAAGVAAAVTGVPYVVIGGPLLGAAGGPLAAPGGRPRRRGGGRPHRRGVERARPPDPCGHLGGRRPRQHVRADRQPRPAVDRARRSGAAPGRRQHGRDVRHRGRHRPPAPPPARADPDAHGAGADDALDPRRGPVRDRRRRVPALAPVRAPVPGRPGRTAHDRHRGGADRHRLALAEEDRRNRGVTCSSPYSPPWGRSSPEACSRPRAQCGSAAGRASSSPTSAGTATSAPSWRRPRRRPSRRPAP